MQSGTLFAVSDLHVGHPENREIVDGLRPESDADWLIVGGDVADRLGDVEWALRTLRERFAKVIWVPGDHELLAHRDDSPEPRGEGRYDHLVELCGKIDVITPEDPYPIWDGEGGPVQVAPLFLLDPHPSRQEWCRARVSQTEKRLAASDPALPMVLINHFSLVETMLTADWHRRFRATAVVYGHHHTPSTTWHDGVRFEEVSLGYPDERRGRGRESFAPRRILPEAPRA